MSKNINPFRKNTISYRDFEKMKDLQWHCTKCELESAQAKTWQVWRQEKGLQLKKDSKGRYFKQKKCITCGITTVHRGLSSLKISDNIIPRSNMPTKLRKRILEHYDNTDSFTLRKEAPSKLEVDHRFPQVRWTEAEEINKINMSEEEIENKFMLLTRENNLLKSRHCEKCAETGKRPGGYGINFWYKGDSIWDDKLKCEGCFWFNPQAWRDKVQHILLNKNNNSKE